MVVVRQLRLMFAHLCLVRFIRASRVFDAAPSLSRYLYFSVSPRVYFCFISFVCVPASRLDVPLVSLSGVIVRCLIIPHVCSRALIRCCCCCLLVSSSHPIFVVVPPRLQMHVVLSRVTLTCYMHLGYRSHGSHALLIARSYFLISALRSVAESVQASPM